MTESALPSNFDYQLYVSVCQRISCFWFMWKPPGRELRVEHYLPADIESYTVIQRWAERTDPDAKIRMQHARTEWESREPGQEVASPFLMVTPCNLSRI